MPFSFQRLEIPDVILVEARAFADERGFFMLGSEPGFRPNDH